MEMQSGFDELLETVWFHGKSLADELQEETNSYFLSTGCYSSDVTFFNQEEDPWMNGYYNYDERLQHLGHNDYNVLDNRSNDCQALQMDSQSELSSILTKLEEAGEIELLQRSIRQSKLDEKEAEESTKRLMAELEDQQKKSREAEIEINNLRSQLELLQAGSFIQALPTTRYTKTTITNELSFRHVDGSKDTIDSINAEEGVAVEVVVACCAADPEEDVRQYKVVPVTNNFRSSSSLEHRDKLLQMNSTGPDGMVINYAIGDSGSEVSFVNLRVRQTIRNTIQLRKALSDEEVVASTSKLVWRIYGNLSSLKDCSSVNCLNLPPRSLNMEMLSKLYPHLREAEFESYSNIKPVMLIGSPHAHLIEGNGKLLESGDKAPVGLSTKLGWTVYGGSSSLKSPKSNQIESTIINLSNKSVELEETQQNIKQINQNPLTKPLTFMTACKNVNFPQYNHSVNLSFYVNQHRCNNLRDLNVKKKKKKKMSLNFWTLP